MKKLFFTVLVFSFLLNTQAQGSGNALQFVNNNHVYIPLSSSLTITNAITAEAWININNVNNPTTIVKNLSTLSGFYLGTDLNDGGIYNVIFYIRNTTGVTTTNRSTFANGNTINGFLTAGKWVHVAATYDGSTAKIYINGVLSNSTTGTALPMSAGGDIFMGNNNFPFDSDCIVDEVKIWNTALTENEIRDRMCLKVKSTDPLFANLKGYYQMNETTGTTTADASGNNNTGTLTTSASGLPTRVTSSAAIGDFGGYSFNSADNYYISITNPVRGDKFNATLTSATSTANGIFIYGINNFPNTVNGALGTGGNNAYYGVFVANKNNATYDAGYSFQTLSDILPANLADLRFYKRNNNATTTWQDANATFSGTSCTAYGQNTEYILGSIGSPLPLQNLQFTASKKNNFNQLCFSTTNETNLKHFEIQKSLDGIIYTTIGQTNAYNSVNNNYTYNDYNTITNTVVYYKLKIVNNNATHSFSNVVKINTIKNNKPTLVPTITSKTITISNYTNALHNTKAVIFNTSGQMIIQTMLQNNSTIIDVHQLATGNYTIQFANNTTVQFVKQ